MILYEFHERMKEFKKTINQIYKSRDIFYFAGLQTNSVVIALVMR